MHTILSFHNSTAMYIKPSKPYTLAGFEPGIFSPVGGRDDHYATLPGPELDWLNRLSKKVLRLNEWETPVFVFVDIDMPLDRDAL
jgi:hypothetical protein